MKIPLRPQARYQIAILPPDVDLQPGQLRVEFDGVEDLLSKLFELARGRSFDFSAPTYGTYVIEVEAVTPDFDPVLYLYEGDAIVEDDDGGSGSVARVVAPLGAGVHRIRVEEPEGLPGICIISITYRSNRR